MEREPSRAKTSSTFTNNAPTPSARAPIQSSPAPQPQGGSEDARQSPAQPCPAGARFSPPAGCCGRGRALQPAREAATASREGSRPEPPPSPLGDHGKAGCALAHEAPGSHLWRHLVPALRRRTGEAVCASGVAPPLLGLLVGESGERFSLGPVLGLRCHPSEDRWHGVGAKAAPRGELRAAGVKFCAEPQPTLLGPVPASRPRQGRASSWGESRGGDGARARVRPTFRESATPHLFRAVLGGDLSSWRRLRRRGEGSRVGTLLLTSVLSGTQGSSDILVLGPPASECRGRGVVRCADTGPGGSRNLCGGEKVVLDGVLGLVLTTPPQNAPRVFFFLSWKGAGNGAFS